MLCRQFSPISVRLLIILRCLCCQVDLIGNRRQVSPPGERINTLQSIVWTRFPYSVKKKLAAEWRRVCFALFFLLKSSHRSAICTCRRGTCRYKQNVCWDGSAWTWNCVGGFLGTFNLSTVYGFLHYITLKILTNFYITSCCILVVLLIATKVIGLRPLIILSSDTTCKIYSFISHSIRVIRASCWLL